MQMLMLLTLANGNVVNARHILKSSAILVLFYTNYY